MKVKYIGFGGYIERPCYEDENGKIYFDENYGRGELNLYSGAYMDEFGDICGEPCEKVTENAECENPFKRHPKEYSYMLLGRLKHDCMGFIKTSGKYRDMWADIDTIIKEMEKIMGSFTPEEKPMWLKDVDFEIMKKEIEKIKTAK